MKKCIIWIYHTDQNSVMSAVKELISCNWVWFMEHPTQKHTDYVYTSKATE